MKRAVLLITVLSFVVVFNVIALAAEKKTSEAALKAKIEAQRSVEEVARRQAMQKAQDALNSKEWTIYLVPSGVSAGKGLRMQTDILTFKGIRIASKNLISRGYNDSNFTLSIAPDGTAIWETMQRNEKEDLVFWRGELRGDTMTGVVGMHPKSGAVEEYSFTTNIPADFLKPQQKVETKAKKDK